MARNERTNTQEFSVERIADYATSLKMLADELAGIVAALREANFTESLLAVGGKKADEGVNSLANLIGNLKNAALPTNLTKRRRQLQDGAASPAPRKPRKKARAGERES